MTNENSIQPDGNDPSTHRDPIEVLADLFMDQCRRGEPPSIDDYAAAHPELASEIRELFPTIAALEGLKTTTKIPANSGPVRGQIEIERLGDYRIVREIGRGGMGIVYEAQQESLGRTVAIKVLPKHVLLDGKQLARFEREARTAAQLHHTNIVPIFGVGQDEGYHFIVMQHIRGVGLDAVLRELMRSSMGVGSAFSSSVHSSQSCYGHSSWPDAHEVAKHLLENATSDAANTPTATVDFTRSDEIDESPPSSTANTASPPLPSVSGEYFRSIARIVRQIADGLAYAHDQGTLHRDIKPGNILIDGFGAVWITDFGLAKAIDQDGVTQPGDVIGTLRYMPPEQLEGKADASSDLFSLGLTLYEFATLRPALPKGAKSGNIHAIATRKLKPPRSIQPLIPRDLDTIIAKCVAYNPQDRYSSARALAEDLRRFLEDRPILARPVSLIERSVRWSKRNPALASLMMTTVVLLMIVSAVSTTAYFETRTANQRAKTAWDAEIDQRKRAEETTDLALEALTAIFDKFAPQNATNTLSTNSISADADIPASTDEIVVPVEPVLSEETVDLLEQMLTFYNRLAAQEGQSDALKPRIADAQQRIGDIHLRLGHFGEAISAYTEARTLWNRIAQDNESDPEPQLQLARIYNEMGTALSATDKRTESHASHHEALKLLLPFETSTKSGTNYELAPVHYELARTLYLIGRTQRPMKPPPHGGPPGMGMLRGFRDPNPGRRHFYDDEGGLPRTPKPPEDSPLPEDSLERAVSILEALIDKQPAAPDHQHLLALCYRELGVGKNFWSLRANEDYRARAVQMLEQLVETYPRVGRYKLDLCETYTMRHPGPLDFISRDAREQRTRMERAVEIAEELVKQQPGDPRFALNLARTHHHFARICEHAHDKELMERSLRKSFEVQRNLTTRFPDVLPFVAESVRFGIALAEFYEREKRFEQAAEVIQNALADVNHMQQAENKPSYVRQLTARCLHTAEAIYRSTADDTKLRRVRARLDEYDIRPRPFDRGDKKRPSQRGRHQGPGDRRGGPPPPRG